METGHVNGYVHTTTATPPTPASPQPTSATTAPATPPPLLDIPPSATTDKALDAASTVPQIDASDFADPDSIPIHPPKGTPPPPAGELLLDVQMAEAEAVPDIPVSVVDGQTPVLPLTESKKRDLDAMQESEDPEPLAEAAPPATASDIVMHTASTVNGIENGIDDSAMQISPVEDVKPLPPAPEPPITQSVSAPAMITRQEDGQPPVKRQRMSREPELTIRTNGLHPRTRTLSREQHKFATNSIRHLKKLGDGAPFLKPVDVVLHKIPHYYNIIKQPMDLGTIEEKLARSNPYAKPGTKQYAAAHSAAAGADDRYFTADEFVADVHLVFDNAVKFNGAEHLVSQMAKRLEAVFDKQIKQMPPPEEPKPVVATPEPPPLPAATSAPVVSAPSPNAPRQPRRQSIAVPVIRRNSPQPLSAGPLSARPKREIHPPPPRDLTYPEPTSAKPKRGKGKGKARDRDDGTAEQLKYCQQILQHLHKKQFYYSASYFYDPVDWQTLQIPDYPKIIKKPMDLGTMRKKLEAKQYDTAQDFYADFKLMIKNCRVYNPVGSTVRTAGDDLNVMFDDKWKGLPPLKPVLPEEEEEEEEEEEDAAMAGVQAQVEMLVKTLEEMRAAKAGRKKKPAPKHDDAKPKAPKRPKAKHNASSNSNVNPADGPVAGPSKPRGRKAKDKDDESDEEGPIDYFKKQELAEEIPRLEGAELTTALELIQTAMGYNQSQEEEVELDIDVLPHPVLRKLYKMVVVPAKKRREAEEKKRARASGVVGGGRAGGNAGKGGSGRKGHPTGGLKRKSMDEQAEAEKIRLLEERLKMFDADNPGAVQDAKRNYEAQQQLRSGPMMDVDESVHSTDSSDSDSDDDSGSE